MYRTVIKFITFTYLLSIFPINVPLTKACTVINGRVTHECEDPHCPIYRSLHPHPQQNTGLHLQQNLKRGSDNLEETSQAGTPSENPQNAHPDPTEPKKLKTAQPLPVLLPAPVPPAPVSMAPRFSIGFNDLPGEILVKILLETSPEVEDLLKMRLNKKLDRAAKIAFLNIYGRKVSTGGTDAEIDQTLQRYFQSLEWSDGPKAKADKFRTYLHYVNLIKGHIAFLSATGLTRTNNSLAQVPPTENQLIALQEARSKIARLSSKVLPNSAAQELLEAEHLYLSGRVPLCPLLPFQKLGEATTKIIRQADQGCSAAQEMAGACFSHEIGREKNRGMALHYLKAANQKKTTNQSNATFGPSPALTDAFPIDLKRALRTHYRQIKDYPHAAQYSRDILKDPASNLNDVDQALKDHGEIENYSMTINILEKAFKTYPVTDHHKVAYAVALYKTDKKRGFEMIEKVLKDPEIKIKASQKRIFANVYLESRNFTRAAEILEQVLADPEAKPLDFKRAMDTYAQLGNMIRATQIMERFLRHPSATLDDKVYIAQFLLKSGNRQRGSEIAEKILSDPTVNSTQMHAIAQSYMEADNHKRATEIWEELLKKPAVTLIDKLWAASFFFRSGNLGRAIEIRENIRALDPNHFNNTLYLAVTYFKLGEKDKALSLVRSVPPEAALQVKSTVNNPETLTTLQHLLALAKGNEP